MSDHAQVEPLAQYVAAKREDAITVNGPLAAVARYTLYVVTPEVALTFQLKFDAWVL